MKICTIYSGMSDKIKSVVFAKKIAEEEARAARKRTIIIACVCAGIAVVAAAAAVGIYFLSKKESVREKVGAIVANVKSKLPCKKAEECECEDCDCEIEIVEEPVDVE